MKSDLNLRKALYFSKPQPLSPKSKTCIEGNTRYIKNRNAVGGKKRTATKSYLKVKANRMIAKAKKNIGAAEKGEVEAWKKRTKSSASDLAK